MLATALETLETCDVRELRALLGVVAIECRDAETAGDFSAAGRAFAQHMALLRVARRRFPDLYQDPTAWPST